MAPLPEGWLGCPETAVRLIDDTFFAFKTPLENFSNKSFTISSVFSHAQKQNWDLGLWIDLTFTEKYFSRNSMKKWNVQYVKLGMPGRQSPSECQTTEFINYCTKFLEENPGKKIACHCTHGFNRTGFLICSFLSQVKKYKPLEAIAKFAEARPPGIYRQILVDEFVRRYSPKLDPLAVAPKVPTNVPWKEKNSKNKATSSRKPLNGGLLPLPIPGQGALVLEKKIKKPKMTQECKKQRLVMKATEEVCRNIKTNLQISFPCFLNKYPEVQRIKDDNERKQQILQELVTLSELPGLTCSSVFQKEVYLNEENFSVLKENHESYSVSWCPQEFFRYILFINSKQEIYMINTRNSIHLIPSFKFPDPENEHQNLESTILEGIILRRRKSEEDNIGWFGFEITNLLAYKGKSTISTNLKGRQDCIVNSILEPRRKVDTRHEPFTIQLKHMWTLPNLAKLQTFKWSSHYTCSPNGLMFFPHTFDKQVLHWKSPQDANSAHFRLFVEYEIDKETDVPPRTILHVDEDEAPFAEISIGTDNSLVPEIGSLNGKIIECTVEENLDQKNWKFKRVALKRKYSDSKELVSNVWDGTIAKNADTKDIFLNFLVTKKRLRTSNKKSSGVKNNVS